MEDVLKQIAIIIAFLHAIGVCHNDIALRNILVLQEDYGSPLKLGCRVFLIDYGLATMVGCDDPVVGRYFRRKVPDGEGGFVLEAEKTRFMWTFEYDKYLFGK